MKADSTLGQDPAVSVEMVLQLPLAETAMEPRLRRALERNGIMTFEDILQNEDAAFNALDRRLSKELDDYINTYNRYQEKFVKRMTAAVERPPAQAISPTPPMKSHERKRVAQKDATLDTGVWITDAPSLPREEYAAKLKDFNQRFEKVITASVDSGESSCVSYCIQEFSDEIYDVLGWFAELFQDNEFRQELIAPLIHAHFPAAFLAFFSQRTNDSFEDNNLWSYFFDGYGLTETTVQELKTLFHDSLVERGLPYYSKQERPGSYYQASALLHGGLSKEAWSDLWVSCLLPLANAGDRKTLVNGYVIYDIIVNRNNTITPKESTLAVLEKMPLASAVRLLEDAYRIAAQATQRNQSAALALDDSLPPAAAATLAPSMDKLNERAKGARGASRANGEGPLLRLPRPFLSFDPRRGRVQISTRSVPVPADYSDCSVRVVVNGTATEERLVKRVNQWFFPRMAFDVKPAPRYDIALSLMRPEKHPTTGEAGDDNDSHDLVIRSIAVAIAPRHEAVWEFAKSAAGSWVRREASAPAKQRESRLYLTKEGISITQSDGTSTGTFALEEPWSGWQGTYIVVEPHSTARLIDALGSIASWSESVTTEVDVHDAIGTSGQGVDLYPCRQPARACGMNTALPVVTLTAADNTIPFDDLQARFSVDGYKIPLPRIEVQWDGKNPNGPQQAQIDLRKCSQMPSWAKRCELEVKDGRGTTLFKYVFSVAPVMGFHLSSIVASPEGYRSTYQFTATEHLVLSTEDGLTALNRGDVFDFEAPSTQPTFHLDLVLDGDIVYPMELDLAPVKIELPRCLTKGIASIPDVAASPSKGWGGITALESRPQFGVFVLEGSLPLIYDNELHAHESHEFNVADRNLLIPSSGEASEIRSVVACISYGVRPVGNGEVRPATCDLELGSCFCGFGPSEATLVVEGNRASIVFDRPLQFRTHVKVTTERNGEAQSIGSKNLDAEQTSLPIERWRLLKRMGGTVTIAPLARLRSKPVNSWAQTLTIPADRKDRR